MFLSQDPQTFAVPRDVNFIKGNFNADNITISYSQSSLSVNGASPVSTITKPYSEVYFFDSSVLIGEQNNGLPTFTGLTAATTISSSKVPIWYLGNKYTFGVFLYRSNASKNTDPVELFNSEGISANLVIGNIKRPNLNTLVNSSGQINFKNLVTISQNAFAKYADNSTLYINLNNSIQSGYASFSVLGLTESDQVNWNIVYSLLDESFESHSAFAATISSVQNQVITANSLLRFTVGANNNNINTNCGVVHDETRYVRQCSVGTSPLGNTGKTFVCQTPLEATSYKICCYNVMLSGSSLAINNVAVSYNNPSDVPTTSATYNLLNKESTSVLSGITLKTATNPSVTSINYIKVANENGLGVAVLSVNLNRKLTPNSVIKISGNLSTLSAYGVVPICSVSVNSSGVYGDLSQGDELFQDCKVVDFSTTSSYIEITTKNELFNCNQTYKSVFFVKISPIKISKLSNIGFSVTINNGSITVASGISSIPINNAIVDATIPVLQEKTTDEKKFCSLKSVYPKIVGSHANYTIEFDYTNIDSELNTRKQVANEFAIYFPVSIYGELNQDKLICSNLALGRVDCYVFENYLVFNTQSRSVLPNNNKIITFEANNIKNRQIINNEVFLCSINYRSADNVTTALATGRINYTSKLTNDVISTNGKFVYVYPKSEEVSTILPRTVGDVSLRVGIDRASNHSFVFSGELVNKPHIIVEVPFTYPLTKYEQTNLTMEIYQINKNAVVGPFTEVAPVLIASGKPEIRGNSLKLTLQSNEQNKPDSYNFSNSFLYFNIVLKKIDFPEEESLDTSYFHVLFTNESNDFLLRTYDNTINSVASQIVINSTTLLNYYRGLSSKYDKKNWVINFENVSNSLGKNYLTVFSGFYSDIVLSIEHFDELQEYAGSFSVAFESTTLDVKTDGEVQFYTINDKLTFKLGVPCRTFNGKHLVAVKVTIPDQQSIKVIYVRQIYVLVLHKTQQISCSLPSESIPFNYSYEFSCSAQNAVDAWDLTYTLKSTIPNTNLEINKKSKTSPWTKYFTFKNTTSEPNPIALNPAFTITSNNMCLTTGASGTNSSEITFSLKPTELTSLLESDLNSFTYSSRLNDVSLRHDQLKFSFNVPSYTELRCAVTCENLEFPSRDSILLDTLTESQNLALIFHQTLGVTTLRSVVVSNIRKNTNYKVKCLLNRTSTLSFEELQKEFTDLPKGTGTEVVPITNDSAVKSKCLIFHLNSFITEEVQERLINVCQNVYSANDNLQNGCMVCTDFEMERFAEGTTPNLQKCRSNYSSELALLTLKEENVSKQGSYTVCAVQNFQCQTQISESTQNTLFETFKSKVDTQAKINTVINAPDRRILNELIELKSVEVVSDTEVPILSECTDENSQSESCFTASLNEFKSSGEFVLSIKLNDSFTCHWAWTRDEATSLEDILNNEQLHSGVLNSIAGQSVFVKNQGQLKKFERGFEYKFYLACTSRRVLFPQTVSQNFNLVLKKNWPTVQKVCPRHDLDLYPEDDGCLCLTIIEGRHVVVPQGIDGSNCSATYLGLLTAMLLFTLLFSII